MGACATIRLRGASIGDANTPRGRRYLAVGSIRAAWARNARRKLLSGILSIPFRQGSSRGRANAQRRYMTESIHFTEGSIVEFADKAKFILAIVVQIEEKSKKIRLSTENNGRDMSVNLKQIQNVLPGRISPQYPPSQIASELLSIKSRAEALAGAIDLEELHALLDDGAEISAGEAVGLLCDDDGAVSHLAVIRAMRNDKFYFKTIQPGTFAKRPQDVVDALKRQADAKAKKDKWIADFAEEAAAVLELDGDSREQILEDVVLPNSKVRDAWEIIEDYALFGADSRERADAEVLIDAVQDKRNRGFSGTANLRARDFLRKAGYWNRQTHVALLRHRVDESFADDVEIAAKAIYDARLNEAGRRDLTCLNVFSIDDAETLDVDDALSLEFMPDGHYRLGVHIAAPAAAAPFDSPIEREARRRASSVYLPEKCIPMMPFILSENCLSLLPGQRRLAMTFFMTFDGEYNLVDSEITPSVVVSKHKLTYESAEAMLEEGNDVTSDELRKIQEICEFCAENRHNSGAIDVDLPEFKFKYDSVTDRYALVPIDGRMMSRMLVAECMILANCLTAEFCSKNNVPTLYRVQAKPTNLPTQDTLDAMPNDYARAYALRRCLQPASTTFVPGPHAGLGVGKYTQATSPLRRYADLMCHYQLEYWFAHGVPRFDAEAFNGYLSEASTGLENGRAAAHEAYRTAALKYFAQRVGDAPKAAHDAIVLQYASERGDLAQVAMLETQIRANVSTKSRLPIGSICRVTIENVNPDAAALSLRFVSSDNA